MGRRKGKPQHPPTRHTVLIGNPVTMWEKLAWDIDEFQDIQRLAPDEREPLVYSAINVCIAAWSLENWVVATLKARWREEPDKTGPRLTALEAHLRQQIAAIELPPNR